MVPKMFAVIVAEVTVEKTESAEEVGVLDPVLVDSVLSCYLRLYSN